MVWAPGTWQGERAALPDHKAATISVLNVNYGDMALPSGTAIKAIRIFQLIPQATPLINQTRIEYGSEASVSLIWMKIPSSLSE
jgi:hypothetical protein